MQCASCVSVLRVESFLTAPCGHAFHDACVRELKCNAAEFECPECDQRVAQKELWRTFWSASGADPSAETKPEGESESGPEALHSAEVDTDSRPAARVRRLFRRQQRLITLHREADTARLALQNSKADLAKQITHEAEMRQSIAQERAALAQAKERSLQSVRSCPSLFP